MDYTKYNREDLFNFTFLIHLVLEILSWASPVLFSWWIIVIGFVLMHLQFKIFGTCVLNKIQFKKHSGDSVFLYPYMKMMGFKISFEKARLLMRYIIPLILIIVAIFWQLIFKKSPILF